MDFRPETYLHRVRISKAEACHLTGEKTRNGLELRR